MLGKRSWRFTPNRVKLRQRLAAIRRIPHSLLAQVPDATSLKSASSLAIDDIDANDPRLRRLAFDVRLGGVLTREKLRTARWCSCCPRKLAW
jgi:hypothetical protein